MGEATEDRDGRTWPLWAWMALALVPPLLLSPASVEPRSPFWWAEPILYALLAAGLLARRGGRPGWRLPLPAAPTYVALSWLFGMAYEASLTWDGTGIGGMHPDTRSSFILAQGDYLLLAVAALGAVSLLRLRIGGALLLSLGVALTEGLVFSGTLVALALSPGAWALPLYVAYFALAYATFLALPLLLVGEERLWRPGPRRPPGALATVALGFALGFAARLLWGLVYIPWAERAFGIAPLP